ncbi:transposase domain-containing protein, partial [Streptococcus pneumoniae]|nr:transposase domain-containing protein [Streptococcus pneumoniae]MDS8370272.1 transposase domain-containing protein [Streptococcus pneumoniae]
KLSLKKRGWLFSQSFEGAKARAIIMSLLETAKRHQLNSEKYLSYLLECLPNVEPLVNKEVLEAYLPWTKVVQEKCK